MTVHDIVQLGGTLLGCKNSRSDSFQPSSSISSLAISWPGMSSLRHSMISIILFPSPVRNVRKYDLSRS